jgi:colicin import membrane protein
MELVRQYTLPLFLALLLHAALVYWLQGSWRPDDRSALKFIKPRIVNSTLLVLEPKAQPAAPAKPKPARPTPVESSQPVAAPPKPDPAQEARKRDEEAARRREEEAAKTRELIAAREAAARQQRLEQLADSAFLSALDEESEALAEDAAADAEAVAQSFRFGIYQKVVANWSRPPSARNGMEAMLQVELVPTGDVVAVMLIESSGSAAFDQSAEAAVRKARRFEVPRDSGIFERHFRRFTLLFKPEDLLR